MKQIPFLFPVQNQSPENYTLLVEKKHGQNAEETKA
jgi:hypothetical protein